MSRFSLLFMALNGVIGAGIYGLPSKLHAAGGAWAIATYGVCAFLIGLVAIAFSEVASHFTESGGSYLHAETFGPLVSFQVGWLMWIARIAAFAALANLLVDYLSAFGLQGGRIPIIFGVGAILTTINLIGIKQAAIFTNILVSIKLFSLLFVLVAGVIAFQGVRFELGAAPSAQQLGHTMILQVFAFLGFESVAIVAGESVEPKKDQRFAVLGALVIVTILYVAIQVVCVGAIPGLAGSKRPLSDVGSAAWGPAAATAIAIGATITLLGTLHNTMLGAARLPFAMAERGQLPPLLGRVHSRFRTPFVSILVTAPAMVGFSLASSFVQSLKIVVLAKVLSLLGSCAALPHVLRSASAKGAAGGPAPRRDGRILSVVSMLACLALVAGAEWADVRDTAVVLVLGFVVWISFRRARKSAPAPG